MNLIIFVVAHVDRKIVDERVMYYKEELKKIEKTLSEIEKLKPQNIQNNQEDNASSLSSDPCSNSVTEVLPTNIDKESYCTQVDPDAFKSSSSLSNGSASLLKETKVAIENIELIFSIKIAELSKRQSTSHSI